MAVLDSRRRSSIETGHLDEKRARRTSGVFTIVAVRYGLGIVGKPEVGQKRGSGRLQRKWHLPTPSINHISAPFIDGSGPPIQLSPAKRLWTGTEPVTSIKLPSTDPN